MNDVTASARGLPRIDDATLERILDVVRAREGLDLRGYRRATLARRVENRMVAAGAPDLEAYLDRLVRERGEAARLVERLTIKVSRFYRNAGAFEAVERALRVELRRAPRRLRIWCAGCGRGEEAYSLAILLGELGQPEGGPPDVLATDVDLAALEAARAAQYGPPSLAELPEALRARWLEPADAPGLVRPAGAALRRVALLRHDVARDPPPAPTFDVVSCRNTLIYFEAALQRLALARLRDALAPGGLLWLGEAEWPAPELAPALEVVDRKARLFRLSPGVPRA